MLDQISFMVKKMIKSLSLPRSDARDTKGIIEELIERKNKHFAEHTRTIVDYQVTETRDGFHLSVASTLTERVDTTGWQPRSTLPVFWLSGCPAFSLFT